jgi:hypothetical protein
MCAGIGAGLNGQPASLMPDSRMGRPAVWMLSISALRRGRRVNSSRPRSKQQSASTLPLASRSYEEPVPLQCGYFGDCYERVRFGVVWKNLFRGRKFIFKKFSN